MALVIVGILVAAVLGMWIVGEMKDVRGLRWTGILLPMLSVPFALQLGFELGAYTGRLDSTTNHESAIASFSKSAEERFDAGDSESVETELRSLANAAREFEAAYGSLREKPAVGEMDWRFEESASRLREINDEVTP